MVKVILTVKKAWGNKKQIGVSSSKNDCNSLDEIANKMYYFNKALEQHNKNPENYNVGDDIEVTVEE